MLGQFCPSLAPVSMSLASLASWPSVPMSMARPAPSLPVLKIRLERTSVPVPALLAMLTPAPPVLAIWLDWVLLKALPISWPPEPLEMEMPVFTR